MSDAFVPLLARALLDFIWQGAIVGLLAWLALALLRNARPQWRYAVACLALLACAVLPIAGLLFAIGATGDASMPAGTPATAITDAAIAAPALHAGAAFALPTPPPASMAWLVALWASGAGLLSLRMLGGALWLRRLCREAHGEAGAWQARVDALAVRLGVRRPVALRLTADGDGPATAGWWRPVILLPAAVAMHLPADLLEALLAHELAHIRRHDYLVNLLQRLVETLLFYHPAVWWLSHRIRIERELVADDLAATALGDRRRLAVALATLDRLAAAPRSPFPLPAFAQAAHGGHLMSRIQQLVRPSRRALGGAVLPPLLGLAVAAGAFYAHAQLAPKPAATPAPHDAAPAKASSAASPDVASRAARVAATHVVARAGDRRDDDGFAIVRKHEDGVTMSGRRDDRDDADIDAAKRGIDGDFLWFRRGGQAYVVRDAATLAQTDAAWAKTRELSAQMEALSARMQPHSEKMQALGARMQALQVEVVQPPEMEAARVEMERLGERMQALGTRQGTLGARMAGADEAERDRLQAQLDALSAEQEGLGREMERQGEIMEAAGRRIEARTAPMEALGREMEAAGQPMEAIGKDMEALGARIERSAAEAETRTRSLIDEAFAKGLATPAPTRQ
ncbi:MAG: M56 family metallopeptidase [Lysobacteraceae bacterium]